MPNDRSSDESEQPDDDDGDDERSEFRIENGELVERVLTRGAVDQAGAARARIRNALSSMIGTAADDLTDDEIDRLIAATRGE